MLYEEKLKKSKKLIVEAISEYDNIAVFCSFGKDSIVITHMAKEIKPDIQVISILTPYKPRETITYANRIINEWNLNAKIYRKEINSKKPKNWHIIDPNACCDYYKIQPTKEAKEENNLDCWITGLRKDEGKTRNNYKHIEKESDGTTKLNPILDWSESDIWKYFAFNGIPVHEWYKIGYRSLGCAKCTTKPMNADEPERAGRWRGTEKCGGECGIHKKWKIKEK